VNNRSPVLLWVIIVETRVRRHIGGTGATLLCHEGLAMMHMKHAVPIGDAIAKAALVAVTVEETRWRQIAENHVVFQVDSES